MDKWAKKERVNKNLKTSKKPTTIEWIYEKIKFRSVNLTKENLKINDVEW